MIVHTASGQRRVHLPWPPLEEQARLLTYRPHGGVKDSVQGDPSIHNAASLGTLFGLHYMRIIHYRRDGHLPLDTAERLAIDALNLHPGYIWGDDWLQAVEEALQIIEDRRLHNNARVARNVQLRRQRGQGTSNTGSASLGL